MESTGAPLETPVGEALLGRMFNVLGQTIDNAPPPQDCAWRPIHQAPVPLAQQATTQEILVTGIKAIDLLAPLEQGGKAGSSAARGWARPCSSPN
ncbi:MAG: hypothetical protein R2851_08860 [Caldilineaceae bacterium]